MFAAVVLVAPVGAGASAQPTDPPPGDPGTVGTAWQDATTHLAWSGGRYTTLETSFLGDRVVAPGDTIQRTLDVTNNGPSAAVMRVSLVVTQTVPPQAVNPGFAGDVTLFWHVAGSAGQARFDSLLAEPEPVVAEVPVGRGATVPVTVGISIASVLQTDRDQGSASTVLGFRVRVHLEGDTADGPRDDPAGAPAGGGVVPGRTAWGIGLLLGGAALSWLARLRPRALPGDRQRTTAL